jgi:glycerol uptake facilitator-like aquaporin
VLARARAAFVYTAIRLFAASLTGSYVNPARSFGITLVSGAGWPTIAVFLFGGPIGALIGAALFIYLNKKALSVDRALIDDL